MSIPPPPALFAAPSAPTAAPTPTNPVALTGMIFGIVGAAAAFWSIVPITGYLSAAIAFPLLVVAVVCGHIGRTRARHLGRIGARQALAAIILGYASLAVSILACAAWTLFLFVGAV